MEKFMLNADGLRKLLAHLYALPDVQLHQEAAAVTADFRAWLNANFELDAGQVSYLQHIGNEFIELAAVRGSRFIRNRSAINLIKAGRAASTSKSTQDKVVIVHEDTKGSYSPGQGYSEEEVLNFIIEYQ